MGVVLGFFSQKISPELGTYVTSLLILLGVIVGFLNITSKETKDFLLTSAVLVFVSGFAVNVFGQVYLLGSYFTGVFTAVMTFVIPSTIIVALKAIYSLASD